MDSALDRILLSLLALVLVLHGCGEPVPKGPRPLAQWKGGIIDEEQFEEIRRERAATSPEPSDSHELQAWRRAILEDFVINHEVEQWMTSEPGSLEGEPLRPSPHEAKLIEIMANRSFRLNVPSDEEIKAYYRENAAEFGHPEQIRLHHIFRRYSLSPTPEEKETVARTMRSLLQEYKNGASFEELARTHSQSETAPKGGLIGNLSKGKMDPELETIIWNLEEGEASNLVPTPQGVHLFWVAIKTPSLEVSLEEARSSILRTLQQRDYHQEEKRLFREFLGLSGASYHPQGLKEEASSVLFQLEERRITRDYFVRWVLEKPFKEQRSHSVGKQLDAVVFRELLLWKARRDKIEEIPEIAAQLQQFRRSSLRADAVNQLLNRELDEVPNQEVESYFQQNSQRFQSPKLYRMRLLTTPFPDRSDPNETYDALRRLVLSINAESTSFSQAARARSEDISAYRDGDLGWIRLDDFAGWVGPQGQKIVESLKKGELSQPFLVQKFDSQELENKRIAFALVRIEDIRESSPRPLEEVRREVVKQWLQANGETLDDWLKQRLIERALLVVH